MTLRIFNTLLTIQGPDDLIKGLMEEYPHARGGHEPGSRLISWEGLECRVEGTSISYRIHSSKLQSDVTRMLIRRAVALEHPNLIFFHGNALLQGGRPYLLLGPSGIGKSTLTIELAGKGEEAVVVAEDLIAIDPTSMNLLPHPRASRLKSPEGEVFHAHEKYGEKAVSLKGAHVYLLNQGTTDVTDVKTSGPNHLQISAWNDRARKIVEEHLGAAIEADFSGTCPFISIDGNLTATLLRDLTRDLEDAGILVMGLKNQIGSSRTAIRPTHPMMTRLLTGEALLKVADQLVGPLSHHGAQLMMQVARSFSEAYFWSLTPGGTPTRTIELILEDSSAA